METTITTPQPRSLVRRLIAPLLLSVGILGGGGWAAYHFTTDGDDQSSGVARSATSATDDLKQLFASPPPDTVVKSKATTNRYTLTPSKTNSETSPLVATTPTATEDRAKPERASSDTTTKIVSATPALGDRYASLTAQESMAAIRESDAKPSAAPEPSIVAGERSDVARGQEPGNQNNPLRASLAKTKTAGQPTLAEQPLRGQAAAANEMFGNSRPPGPAATDNGASARYSANTLQQTKPTIDVASARQPAPEYELQQQQPVGRQDLGIPATGLETNLGSPIGITPTPGLTNTPGTGRPGERLLEGPQTPSITIQKLAPEEIQVGRRCTFAIRVQNTGQKTAQNVQIHDEVPLGTELVGTAPRASVSGSKVVWDVGTLSVGEERTVEMELMPSEEGDLGSVATVTFATQASAKARCTRPELALRLSCKPQVHAGQQHIVQVELSNPGSGEATGVMLLETVPNGVSHEAGPALEFEIGTLRPGESRRLELLLTAEEAGKVSNVMTARADASLQVQASCEFEVIAPDLQVTVEGPKKRYLERPATYHVNIENPGTASAKQVQLVTQLPRGLQFVSANNMGEYDPGSHSIRWSLAELPANERGTVELVTLPIETGEHTVQVATKALQGLEDRTEARVQVDGIVALMFEVNDLESPIEIGGETTYEIRVANQGSKAAANVQVAAIMPQGMRAISGEGESRHAIQGERVIFAPLAQLASKAESVFRIHAQGLRAGDQRVRVQVTSDEVQQPITEEVSTRVYADQ